MMEKDPLAWAEFWGRLFGLVQCSHCREWKPQEDFGHSLYYACVCLDCQCKYDLCPDCGGPVKIKKEYANLPFVCTGYHYVEGQSGPIVPCGTFMVAERRKTIDR